MPATIFSSPLQFAITCVILVIAQIVYVVFGFGSGLIAVGALALVFPEIKDVVVLLLLVNLPAELWVCLQSRREIRWRPIAILGVGAEAGGCGGGRFHPPAWAAPPAGLISGLLTGLFGTGGPPLIIWYHLTAGSKKAFRGNLMTIFLLMTFVRVPSYAANGLITPVRLWSTLAVMPAVFLGAWLGHRLHIRLSEKVFRLLVSGLLFVLGLMQVIR